MDHKNVSINIGLQFTLSVNLNLQKKNMNINFIKICLDISVHNKSLEIFNSKYSIPSKKYDKLLIFQMNNFILIYKIFNINFYKLQKY